MKQKSQKHIQINSASKSMVTVLSITLSIVLATIISSKYLLAMNSYQSKVISEKKKVDKILSDNAKNTDKLVEDFKIFDKTTESMIGSNEPNSKIILDALPSKYDFPALITSIQKIAETGGYQIESISGTDQELSIDQEPSGSPSPVAIPISITMQGSYDSAQNFVKDLEATIRPIKVKNLSFVGTSSGLIITIDAETYFQPGKNFNVTEVPLR